MSRLLFVFKRTPDETKKGETEWMNTVTLKDALEATGGTLLGTFDDLNVEIHEAFSYSKYHRPGAIFIPYTGTDIDGHSFIDEALANGCLGCLTEKELDHYRDDKFYILVDDALEAIWKIATLNRDKLRAKIICVTGSVGKTTTTAMIAHVLRSRYNVIETYENRNDEFLGPEILMKVNDSYDYAVIELGVGMHSSVRKMSKLIKPDAIVLTNIGYAHIGKTGSLEATRDEKCSTEEGLQEKGIVFVNRNDKMLMDYPYKHRVVYYGSDPDLQCNLHIPPYFVQAALAAKEVGHVCGLNDVEITRQILSFKPPEGRMDVVRGANFTLIDSSFNASIESMRMALNTLKSFLGKHIAVLGEMLEIGDYADELHRQLAQMCDDIDTVIFFGPHAKLIGESISDKVEYHGIESVNDPFRIAVSIYDGCKHGETVLLKGSHASNVWKIKEALKEIMV